MTQCMVSGVPCSRVSSKAFSTFWIDLNHGVLTVGYGEPGQGVCHQWRDTMEIPGVQHIGLSCWDRHVSYRSIALQPPLDPAGLAQARAAAAAAAAGHDSDGGAAVPALFTATCSAIIAATTPANVCRTLHVAELLLPTTQKLYRFCLDYMARHFEAVAGDLAGDGGGSGAAEATHDRDLRAVSAAAMADLVCQNTFSVDEHEIFDAVRDWAASYVEAAAADAGAEMAADGCAEPAAGGAAGEAPAGLRAEAIWGSQGGTRHYEGGGPEAVHGGIDGSGLGTETGAVRLAYLATAAGAGGGTAPARRAATMDALHGAVTPPDPCAAARHSSAPELPTPLSLQDEASAPPPPDAHVRAFTELGIHFGARRGGPTHGSELAEAEAAAARVLSLIRFPMLPVDVLGGCLSDPLLARLPGVRPLAVEALEVHSRETGAAAPAGTRMAAAGATGGSGGPALGCSRCSSLSERRLVQPGAGGGAGGGVPAAGTPRGAPPQAPDAGGGACAAGHGDTAAAEGGGGGSPSPWSVRFQRRCLPFAQELSYVCDGDECGVLHFLGTQYGAVGWVNPLLAKRVDVRASSPTGRTTDPRVVVGRQFVRTNFAGPRFVNGVASSWWQIDLGEPHRLALTYYTLRQDGSADYPRHWVMQGSNDLLNWTDLKRHVGDASIKLPGQYASWPVLGPAAAAPYRAFRLLLAGPNASPSPESRGHFALSNLELYGHLHKGGGWGLEKEG